MEIDKRTMKPGRLKIWALQLALVFVVVICAVYYYSVPFRESVQRHAVWFAFVPAVLLVIAILAPPWGVTFFFGKSKAPNRLRIKAAQLTVAYILVVCGLYLASAPFEEEVRDRWPRFLVAPAALLAVAVLDKILELYVKRKAPGRVRAWLIQLTTLYMVVVCVVYLINAPFREYVQDHWLGWAGALVALLATAILARPRGLELYREYPESDERETINQLTNLLVRRLERRHGSELSLRNMHPKSNGLVLAEFEVLPNLPPDLSVGLFATPKRYPCWLRFSNSSTHIQHDAAKDFRGIAVKLFEVPGDKLQDDEEETFDFLFIGHDAFYAANPKDFLSFVADATHYGTKFGSLCYFIPKRIRLLRNSLVGRRRFGHPFEITWFSCAPYKFGSKVVKYKLHSDWPKSEPDRGSADYLRQRLTKTLRQQGHTMDFMVQFQEDPNRDLIESTASPWRVPQFRTVAKLHIPQQNVDSLDRLRLDENMTFNPWHCWPAHRPLGGMNRARRDVLRAVQEFRLAQNGEQRSNLVNSVSQDVGGSSTKKRKVKS